MITASKLITLDRFISREQRKYPNVSGAFSDILHDFTFAIRLISNEVRRAGINDILGLTDTVNIHGEKVRKIDEYANDVIRKTMNYNGHIGIMVSEEVNDMIQSNTKDNNNAKYILAYDPIDGSTNIDVNVTIGTIFSLYRKVKDFTDESSFRENALQPGYKQVAAGYALYGSSTIFVYTTGNGVNVFTFDPAIGEFILSFENIKMPQKGFHYSCNEANSLKWDVRIQKFLHDMKSNQLNGGKKYISRYIATAVADIHRILHFGGIYMYPSEKMLPKGKIRLMYEANPLAMIIEQAGGRAVTGSERILDVIPENIHQTVPFFVGSRENINELIHYLEN